MPESLWAPRGAAALAWAGHDRDSLRARAGLVKDKQEIEFQYDATGLYGIIIHTPGVQYQGQDPLLGMYLIGSLTGADDENNQISAGSDGKRLRRYGDADGQPSTGSPFTLRCQRVDARTLQIDVTVGPLEKLHKMLSFPCDPSLVAFGAGHFTLARAGYLVGCGNSWSPRSGASARFDTIPQPCLIPGAGQVGLARTGRADAWAEISAPGWGTIRRTVLAGNTVDRAFYRHPGTHNIEYSWANNLAAGSTLTHREHLTVTPWGAGPIPAPPAAPTFTSPPRVAALTPETVRVEWTAPGTTAVLRGWREADPTGVLTLSVTSPWAYAGLTPATRYVIELTIKNAASATAMQRLTFTTPGAAPPPTPIPAPVPSPPPEDAMRVRIDVEKQSVELEIANQPIELALKLTVTPLQPGPVTPPPGDPPPTGEESPYVRWSDAGVCTIDQIQRIYLEQFGRSPSEADLQHELSLNRTPAQLWWLLSDPRLPEYVALHPGPRPVAPPSLGGPPIGMPPDTPVPGPTDPTIKHPVHRVGPSIGLGVVNRWPWIDPDALGRALYQAGLDFTNIEYIPWWQSMTDGVNAPSPTGGKVTTVYPAEAKRFIEAMIRWSITTFVTLRNWNSKPQQSMSDDDLRRDLNHLRSIAAPTAMLRSGRPVLVVEGVSEPSGGGKHSAWNRIVSQEWHAQGGKTLANRDGKAAGPYTWEDYHHCSDVTAATVKGGMLNSTDCGPVINPGPARAAKMTRVCIDRDCGLLIYDFHKGPPELPTGIDFQTIAAMGVEVQKGGHGTYRWDPALLGTGPVTPGPGPTPPSDGSSSDMIPISEIVWIRDNERDAATFRRTATLSNVRFNGQEFTFDLSDITRWPKGNVDAAPANFLSGIKVNGQWHMSAWEWMGWGTRNRRVEGGQHLGWNLSNGTGMNPREQLVRANPPKKGDEIAVMVTSVVRGSQRTVNERSNLVVVRMS